MSPATSLPTRVALMAVGTLVGAYGAWLLLSREGLGAVGDVVVWLAAGVVLHDGVVAPLVLVLAIALRRVGDAWRRPLVVLLVVLGSLTVLAVPVLGRFGARPLNPTLLDRPYDTSWIVLAAVSVALVVVAGVVGSRRRHTP